MNLEMFKARRLLRIGLFAVAALLSAMLVTYIFAFSVITTALLSVALMTSFEMCTQLVFAFQKGLVPPPGLHQLTAYSALTPQQNEAVQNLRQRYGAQVRQQGVEAVLQDFKTFLEAQYRRKPVEYNGRAYPLEHQAGLPNDVLRLYYTHPIHSAHRYLFQRPNPWMSAAASYTESVNRGRAAMLTPESKELVAFMWLAANDQNMPLPPGFTKRRQLLKELARTLHTLNRFHCNNNDFIGDNPSCPAGCQNRFAQYIVMFLNPQRLHQEPNDVRPEQRDLTTAIIRQRFVARVLAKEGLNDSVIAKMDRLNQADFEVFEKAFEDLIDLEQLTPERQAIVDRVKPSQAVVDAFVEECKLEYGAQRITQPTQQISYLNGEVLTSYEVLIRRWAQIPDAMLQFGIEIQAAIEQCKRRANVEPLTNPVIYQFNQRAQPDPLGHPPIHREVVDRNPQTPVLETRENLSPRPNQ